MKIALLNHKYQSFIIIAITLAMFAFASTNFFKQQAAWQYFQSIVVIGAFSIAAVGAWFRKAWVQYCFFLPAIYCLLLSIYTLLALTVRMCCNEIGANMAINIFIVLYIFALIYYATAYLARYFFAGLLTFKHNNFTHFLLASGVAACAIGASVWSDYLVNFMISDSLKERYYVAVFSLLKPLNIAESWSMLIVSAPLLFLNSLIVIIYVFIISRLVGAWNRWHVLMGTLYICFLLFFVFGSQYLIGYLTGRGFRVMFNDVFIRWGIILVIFYISGLFATRKQVSKNNQWA